MVGRNVPSGGWHHVGMRLTQISLQGRCFGEERGLQKVAEKAIPLESSV